MRETPCPNARFTPPVHTCSICAGGIFPGEEYADRCGEPICNDCLNNMTVHELVELFGGKWRKAQMKAQKKTLLDVIRETAGQNLPVIIIDKDNKLLPFLSLDKGAFVSEYLLATDEEHVIFKVYTDMMRILEEFLSPEEYEHLPESESECKAIFDALPWKKCIAVESEPFYTYPGG